MSEDNIRLATGGIILQQRHAVAVELRLEDFPVYADARWGLE